MKNKSFTLIELLVVIALIGLLASIILVSLKGTRGKARIAKGLEFSQSVQNVLGAEAVGIWSFDDCGNDGDTPTTLSDTSGYGNQGTNYGAICREDTPYRVTGSGQGKYALSFDGVDDYVRDSTPTGLNFVSTNQITIEAWFKLTGHSAYDGIISINDGSCAYRIMADQNLYPFYDPGAHNDQTVTTYRFTVNTWYHYAMTVQGGGNAVIYVNGASIHTSSAGVPANLPNGNDILIGTGEGPGTHPTQGLIDEVRIYNTALSLGEIQKHYAEGLGRYRLTQINK